MLAVGMNGHGDAAVKANDVTGRAFLPVYHNIFRMEYAVFAGAEGKHVQTGIIIARQQVIVAADEHTAARLDIRHHFGLGQKYTVTIPQIFQMAAADVGKHRYIRAHDFCQIFHFPEVIDAHFHNSRTMLGIDAGQGHGNAHVVVVVLVGLQNREPLLQNGGDHFLHGGFAHRACDAHNGNLQGGAVSRSNITHSRHNVFHNNAGTGLPFGHMGHQTGIRTLIKGHGNKFVSVYILPGQCTEEIAFLHQSAVDDDFIGLTNSKRAVTHIIAAAGSSHGNQIQSCHLLYFSIDTSMIFSHSSP